MIPWIPPNHILLAVIYSKSIMIVMFVFQASLQVGYTDTYSNLAWQWTLPLYMFFMLFFAAGKQKP